MTKEELNKYFQWMKKNIEDYIDECGEVDCTSLAENCADNFYIYEDEIDFKIPDEIFDLAVEASQWFEGNG